VIPASIAGVTRNVPCTRHRLYIPHLDLQLTAVTTLMEISDDKKAFEIHFQRILGKQRILAYHAKTDTGADVVTGWRPTLPRPPPASNTLLDHYHRIIRGGSRTSCKSSAGRNSYCALTWKNLRVL
jgi:hypothetical protein